MRRRPPTLLLAAVVALASTMPAAADLLCRFDTECLEGEACAESAFTLTLETLLAPGTLFAEGGFPTGDRAVTDAGSVEIDWAAAGPALAAYWFTRTGFHLLSFDAAGVARYSAHLPEAGLSVLYTGTCERD